MKPSPVPSKREQIAQAVEAYLRRLPEPNDLPLSVEIKIVLPEATEVHRMDFARENPSSVAKGDTFPRGKAIDDVVDAYNRICGGKLPKVRMLTDARRRTVAARVREHGSDLMIEMFRRAAESDFLGGKNDRGWRADFDFLMKPASIAHVMEGKYDNRKRQAAQAQSFDVNEFFDAAVAKSYGKG